MGRPNPSPSGVLDVPASRGRKPVDHAGRRFGRLVVVEYAGRKVTDPRRGCGYAMWRCVCDCGAESVVASRDLVDGSTRSCGCLFRETVVGRGGWNLLDAGESAFNQLFYAYQRSAKTRGYEWALPRELFRALTSQPCFYCGAEPETKFRAAVGTNGNYVGNGVDRIDNALGYTPENVRACCKVCNVAKGALSEDEWARWITRVYSHFASVRLEHG